MHILKLLFSVSLLLLAGSSLGQVEPEGESFDITTFDDSFGTNPDTAPLSDGRFVVTWQDSRLGSQKILGRLLDAAGAPVGDEFLISESATTAQVSPAVAGAPDGGFVVAWNSGITQQDSLDVKARRYDSTGSPLTASQFVLTGAPFSATAPRVGPAVAVNDQGSALLVAEDTEIAGRLMDTAGAFVGASFAISSGGSDNQYGPAVADRDSDFVVSWTALSSTGDDSSYLSVQGRGVSAAGLPTGNAFQVNTFTTDDQKSPAITATLDGYLVVWQSRSQGGVVFPPTFSSARGRLLDAAGSPVGDDFLIHEEPQQGPSVLAPFDAALLSEGTLWTSWRQQDSSLDSRETLAGHGLSPAGDPYGAIFVHEEPPEIDNLIRLNPQIAPFPSDNRFLAVWAGRQDNTMQPITGRVFRVIEAPSVPVFGDDFETGDTTSWDVEVP